MAFPNGSVISETLQEITNIKLEELSKRRADFENAKSNVLAMLEDEKDPMRRLHILNQGVKACYALKLGKSKKVPNATQSSNSELELELNNLNCFLAQAKYDPSVSVNMMHTWEQSLLRHLDTQSLKYEYASLYAQLVTEWLSTEKSQEDDKDNVAMTEGYEDVADATKQDARQQWESTIFEPTTVDEYKLRSYLDQLFGTQNTNASPALEALNKLKDSIAGFEDRMSMPDQFDTTTLTWVADGLLSSDLLSDEKRQVLSDFKNDPIILSEVADVLNMRISALDSWSWGSSVPLEQRRQITGVYNVLMHEDLLQALFLHYIGVKWSIFLKTAFVAFRDTAGAWKSSSKVISDTDAKRRQYYLGHERSQNHTVQFVRDEIYHQHYFLAQLMDHRSQRSEDSDGEEEADYHVTQDQADAPYSYMQSQPAMYSKSPDPAIKSREAHLRLSHRVARRLARKVRNKFVEEDDTDSDDSDEDDSDSSDKRPMKSKQRLLQLLSTEIAINTNLYGEITVFHSMFEKWYTLLPHETILAVLSFFGVSEIWLNFFRKFLKAPLKFLDDDPSIPARDRSRGTPASHVLSHVFGESVLFCLDYAVNQSTGGAVLFRMQSDFWFWSGDHSAAVTAWKSVNKFADATGTYIDPSKTGTTRISRDPTISLEIDRSLPTGSIRWGFLKLSPQTGKFEIDQKMVDRHIVDLRKQLQDKRKSIISFIQAWNTYVATFFTSNFGEVANCFGQDHVAQMLTTHERIQHEVFSSSSSLSSGSGNHQGVMNIVDYLKNLIQERFSVSDIPDAYLFFPVELGGLDLKSPFISILQVHDTVLQDSNKELETFFKAEKDSYHSLKIAFESGRVKRSNLYGMSKEDLNNFMSFSEFIRYREVVPYDFNGNLYEVYKRLLEIPEKKGILNADARVLKGTQALSGLGGLKGIKVYWYSMEPYWKWVAQLYGPEVMDRFGGLNMVEPGLLPMGMVSIFRDKRVKWQG
ncbi:hypothetical protein F5Y06DRAFT_305342 [Hypoxylon sp. FL0890]|nr:hypothetical protein F5Y06DRAFT_305342 [Hypoxylon sp. FL0890]